MKTPKGRELLDIDRARRNWERGSPPPDDLTDRLTAVKAPRDTYAAGRALLEQLEREVAAQFPERLPMLRPFVDRIGQLLTVMGGTPGATEADVAAARTSFVLAVRDLEDLCEVFAFAGSPR